MLRQQSASALVSVSASLVGVLFPFSLVPTTGRHQERHTNPGCLDKLHLCCSCVFGTLDLRPDATSTVTLDRSDRTDKVP
jgi:hypothetical protein